MQQEKKVEDEITFKENSQTKHILSVFCVVVFLSFTLLHRTGRLIGFISMFLYHNHSHVIRNESLLCFYHIHFNHLTNFIESSKKNCLISFSLIDEIDLVFASMFCFVICWFNSIACFMIAWDILLSKSQFANSNSNWLIFNEKVK